MSEEASFSVESTATTASKEIEREIGLDSTSSVGPSAVGSQRVQELGEALFAAIEILTRSIPIPDSARELTGRQITRDLARAIALQTTLESDPRFQLLNRVIHLGETPQLRRSLETIARARTSLNCRGIQNLETEREHIVEALDTLSEATRHAHLGLVECEQRVLGKIAARSLESLGYSLARKNRPDGLLVRGYKQDLSVAVQVTPDGEIVIDTAGFGANDCAAEVKKVDAAMAERGVKLTLKRRNVHGRAEGGSLIGACNRETGWAFDPLRCSSPSRRRARKAAAQKLHQET